MSGGAVSQTIRRDTGPPAPWKKVPPVAWVVLGMIAFFGATAPGFFTGGNFLNIMLQGSVLLIMAVAATLVILTEGIDLSLGSVLTLAGVTAVLALQRGLPVPLAVLVGVLTGVACGMVTGFLVTAGKLPSFIATLGMMGIAAGLALVLTRQGAIYSDVPAFVFLGGGSIGIIPMPTVIATLVFVLGWIVLYQTDFGRYIISIGGNEAGARLSGVNTAWWKFLTYVAAGALAALGGVIMAARLHAADPIVGNGWEFDAIAATILGGTSFEKGNGSIGGTVLGVLLISVLRNGLNVIGVGAMWQPALIGLVIIAAIVFDVLLKQRGMIE
jgi:ribose/xylose/arabinose/galactoside ABC-type transport system permease subunit